MVRRRSTVRFRYGALLAEWPGYYAGFLAVLSSTDSSHAHTVSIGIGGQPTSAREALREVAASRPSERRSLRNSARDHGFSIARANSRSTSRSRSCTISAIFGEVTSNAA